MPQPFEHNISLSSSTFHVLPVADLLPLRAVILGLVILIAMWNGARQAATARAR